MDSSTKPGLDWSAIRHRLEAIQQTVEQGWKQSAEDKAQVLRARARKLARGARRNGPPEQSVDVVKFLLAQEQYGVELKYVREVYPLKDLTPLPGTPAFILGITNVRGQVLPIMDIKKLFGLPDKGLTDLNKVVIVHAPGTELGVLADTVLGLESVPTEEIQRSLPTLHGIRGQFLWGVTRHSMVLLDAEKLLSLRQTGW